MEETVSKEADKLKREINSIWDEGAPGYDEQYAHGLHGEAEKQAWLVALKEMVGPGPGAGGPALEVADVGTGTGFIALLLAELGHRVQGFDLSEEMLEVGRTKARQAGLAVEFKTGDAEKLPCDDSHFDVVINRHLLWTLPQPVAALSEWKRIARDGGRLIVIDGLWGLKASLPQNLQKQAGRFLLAIQKRFVARKSQGERPTHHYTSQVMSQLPVMRLQTEQEVLALFAQAQLTAVKTEYLPQVDAVERHTMPFANRLANTTQRHYAISVPVYK